MTSDIFMVNKSISYVSVKLPNLNLYFALDIIFNYISEKISKDKLVLGGWGGALFSSLIG